LLAVSTTPSEVDGPIKVWEVATGRDLPQFAGRGWGRKLQFNANGKRLMCQSMIPTIQENGAGLGPSNPSVVSIWDVATRKKLHEITVPSDYVVMAPDAETIAIEDKERQTIGYSGPRKLDHPVS
jgi:hypothetical protein